MLVNNMFGINRGFFAPYAECDFMYSYMDASRFFGHEQCSHLSIYWFFYIILFVAFVYFYEFVESRSIAFIQESKNMALEQSDSFLCPVACTSCEYLDIPCADCSYCSLILSGHKYKD